MHLDDQVLFIHCPRTSGTAIRRSLLSGADPNARVQWPEDLGKHAFARQLQERLPSEVWNTRFKFGVVRNPWDRMVSLYGLFRRPAEMARQQRLAQVKWGYMPEYPVNTGKFLNSLSNVPAEVAAQKHRKIAFCKAAFGLGFKDWLKFCDDHQWQACPYLGMRPMTRIPQSRWFDGLDKVFRFEDREEIDDALISRGYPAPKVENATQRMPWQVYYDSATHDLVAKTYAEDIRRFGY